MVAMHETLSSSTERAHPRLSMPSSPHDALFKETFGQTDIARSELEVVLPADVRAHLDLATLAVHPGSFVDEERSPSASMTWSSTSLMRSTRT
jgi:hypothetical protein